MSPQELADEINKLVTESVDKYVSFAERKQRNLYLSLLPYLQNLSLTKDGFIKPTVSNLREYEKIVAVLPQLTGLDQGVNKLSGVMDQLTNELDTYFLETFGNRWTPNANFADQNKANALLNIRAAFSESGLSGAVNRSISSQVNQYITTGGEFAVMLEQLRQSILGYATRKGAFISQQGFHTRTYLNDALRGYNRSFMQYAARNVKATNYFYSGGTVEDTRQFCMDRKGKTWTKEQVQSWASLEWQGKNPATTKDTIFTYVGGFNCRHELIPVP